MTPSAGVTVNSIGSTVSPSFKQIEFNGKSRKTGSLGIIKSIDVASPQQRYGSAKSATTVLPPNTCVTVEVLSGKKILLPGSSAISLVTSIKDPL